MLSLDSCRVSQSLPLPTGCEFSFWSRHMLGSAITFSLIIQHPAQLHLLPQNLMDVMKQKEIHLGQLWGNLIVFSTQSRILQTPYELK